MRTIQGRPALLPVVHWRAPRGDVNKFCKGKQHVRERLLVNGSRSLCKRGSKELADASWIGRIFASSDQGEATSV
eukprot:10007603-Heterocapsa_arctica.AAC.1